MTKAIKILLIVGGIVLMGAIIFIITLFRKNETQSARIAADKEKLVLLDSLSASQVRERQITKLLIAEKDNHISDLKYNDSISNVHFLQNQIIYKQLNAELKNIPINIARIAHNDDSIRAAFHRE